MGALSLAAIFELFLPNVLFASLRLFGFEFQVSVFYKLFLFIDRQYVLTWWRVYGLRKVGFTLDGDTKKSNNPNLEFKRIQDSDKVNRTILIVFWNPIRYSGLVFTIIMNLCAANMSSGREWEVILWPTNVFLVVVVSSNIGVGNFFDFFQYSRYNPTVNSKK